MWSRRIALLFLDHSTRRGWGVSVTSRPLFISRKDPVPIVREAGWGPGPVWTSVENLSPTGIRSPDRPARSQTLYRLSYRPTLYEEEYEQKECPSAPILTGHILPTRTQKSELHPQPYRHCVRDLGSPDIKCAHSTARVPTANTMTKYSQQNVGLTSQ